MDEIVINVEFEKENATESLSNEVQLVSSEISWEDFELMVGRFADVWSLFLLRNARPLEDTSYAPVV